MGVDNPSFNVLSELQERDLNDSGEAINELTSVMMIKSYKMYCNDYKSRTDRCTHTHAGATLLLLLIKNRSVAMRTEEEENIGFKRHVDCARRSNSHDDISEEVHD